MPIRRIGEFLEAGDLQGGCSLGIESDCLPDCVAEVQRRKISGVFGSPGFGFREDNLNFLGDLPDLERVWFWDIDLKDIDGLYRLKKLSHFGVQRKRVAIDFSRFSNLKNMVWHPQRGDSGVNQLSNLRNLDLWRFKPREKSYKALQLPSGLEKLEINWSNPADLEGMPVLPKLRELQFHYCRNMVGIDRIAEIAPNLKRLIVTRCPNLAEFESVRALELDHLYINIKGKVVVSSQRSREES